MYEPDSILVLKSPRSTPEQPFAYDRVRVVGTSPISHSGQSSEWVGAAGQGIIIEPLDGFGSNLDEPYGKLAALYDVESVPEHEIEVQKIVKRTQAQMGPSPEETFAASADTDTSRKVAKTHKRKSPIGDDPRPKVTSSPLDSSTTPAVVEDELVPATPASPLDVPPVGADVE